VSEQTNPVQVSEVPEGWDEEAPDAFTRLRNHAKTLATDLKTKAQQDAERDAELERYRKRDRFLESLGDIQGVSFEDVKDVPLEQITPTLLKVKAEEKSKSADTELEALAKKAGFEDVGQFKTAVQTLTGMQEQERQQLASQTAAASATGVVTPPGDLTPAEAGTKAYQEAKAQGIAEDRAQAEYLRASRERQQEINAAAAERQ
jgi:hypothetical protein